MRIEAWVCVTVTAMVVAMAALVGPTARADDAATSAVAAATDESAAPPMKDGRLQLRHAPPGGNGGRFPLTERVWPEKVGQGHVCLWADDKYAAASITIDDNCQPDHAWWIEQGNKYGIRFTWFVVTGGIGKPTNGFAGKWEDFQKLQAMGHDVQSHTVSHHSDDAKRPDDEVEAQYRDSQKAIEENVPGSRPVCMAYPYGSGKDEIAAKYFIACRGVHGSPNRANSTGYMRTGSASIDPATVDLLLTGEHKTVKWMNSPVNRRGWLTPVYHYVHAGRTPEEKAKTLETVTKQVEYLASKKDEIWIGLFREVATYGQERDTAHLVMTKTGDDEVRFTLSDDMDDTLYDYPLTIKVRVADGWAKVAATQGGKAADASVVEHEGAKFALVKATPDRGEVVVRKGE